MYAKSVKRALDFIFALVLLVVLFIPMLFIALMIRIDSRGAVIFKQTRIGLNEEPFEIYKFRTMRVDAPSEMPTHMLVGSRSYITRVGRFLRLSSIDELPQLYNILVGDMSFVGPRPALWNQYDLIAEREKYGANDITPGLTGWAQVNGRDELEIAEKARIDGQYTQHISFKMDWTCFWMTVGNVLKSKGVVEGGTGVMTKQIEKREAEVKETDNKNTKDKVISK